MQNASMTKARQSLSQCMGEPCHACLLALSSEHSVFVQSQGSEVGQTLACMGKKNGVKVVAAIR